MPDEIEFTDEKAAENKIEQLRKMITTNQILHQKVVLYQPIGLKELQSYAQDIGCTVSETFIINFCDLHCISFFQEDKIPIKGPLKPKVRRK